MNQEKADERPRYNYKESRERKKKFIRYKEGAEMYSMGLHTFMNLAKEAGAVHKYGGVCLVNIEKVDEYLEAFRLDPEWSFKR